MAAPSGTVWGSVVGDYGRVGIHVKLTHTNTHTTRVITLWFWSKYGVSDSSNTLYYDAGTTNATSSKGAVSISTSVSSGSGWSTSNQVKLKEYSHTYARGTSDWSESCAMKLAGIDRVGGTMTASTSYTVPKLASYIISYNENGGSGGPSNDTKYYGKTLTISTKQPTRTGHKFQGWATSLTGSVVYASGASYTANAGVTLYAVWKADTYTVTYDGNANSVANVPASDTKTYGVAFKISSKIPTRTGHTFQGWATSKTGSVAYAAGANYIANASVTLYAKWTANTYTVSYDANGGSGGPSNDTKTHGQTLTLSSVTPTKPNYNFLGWGTSSTATTVSYKAGANYTANAGITLYAIWELAYTKPRISSISVFRCDDAGNPSDDGTNIKVAFSWETDKDVTAIIIEYKDSTATKGTEVPLSEEISGTNGSIDERIQGISVDASYDVRITVADGDTDAYKTPITRSIAGASYPIDVKKGGGGVAFGKPAEKDGLECDFKAYFNSDLSSNLFLGKDVDEFSSSKIIIFPSIAYGKLDTLYGTTGTEDDKYFKNLLRWLCENYSSHEGYVFIGRVNPNSAGIAIIHIYNTSLVDSTTKLPQYSSGLYVRLGNAPMNFGTSTYTYYAKYALLTTGGTINGNLNITGTLSRNSNTVLDAANYTSYCAKASHTHSYLPLSGGDLTGSVTTANNYGHHVKNTSGTALRGIAMNTSNQFLVGQTGNATYIYGSSMYFEVASGGRIYIQSATTLNHQMNLGSNKASDGNNYYINNNATARFNSLKYASSGGYSSRRYKNRIEYKDVNYWHDAVMQMKICTYYYNNDEYTKRLGLIAEDLYELIPELVGIDEEGKPSSVEYGSLTIPIIGEVQRLNNVIDEQQKEIDSLKEEMQQLKELVAKIVS